MQRITKDSEVQDVLMDLGVGEGEKLRESEKRRTHLEKFAQLRSRNPYTTLTLDDTHTAFVKVDESSENEEFRDITITTRKFEQIKTDLPERYHDYLMQKGMTIHEIGHILYSNWPAFEKHLDKVGEDREEQEQKRLQLMFKNFWNVIEDGAIEKYLSNDYRVEEELNVLRATLHDDQYMGKEVTTSDGEMYKYPFFFAIMTAAMNIAVYDNGELDKLTDPNNEKHAFGKAGSEHDFKLFVDKCVPEIRRSVPIIHSKTDAEERTDKIYELWEFLLQYIDQAHTPGKMEWERQMGSQEGNSYLPGVPENLSESHGEQQETPIQIADGDEEEGGEDKSFGEGRGEEMEAGSSSHGDIEEKAKEGVVSEAKQHGDTDWSDEIESIIDSLQGGDGIDELSIAEDREINQDRKKNSQRHGRRAEKLFARRLRQLQKDKIVRNKRRGPLDTTRLMQGERGNPRIFKQIKKGKERNYSCMIVLDRSGSMSDHIDKVELSAGTIAYGLQENGVDTCILDTYDSKTTLSKPFGTPVEQFEGKIFGSRTGGGTPLRHTVNFARERMERGEGDYPFMIIITDGKPRSREKFMEAVRKANFPVLGLYLTDKKRGLDEQLKLYDRAVVCGSDEDVSRKLIALINKIMF